MTRGVCAVGGLVCNQFLHTLSLSQNSFDKKCAELLAQCLVHNETLTNLDLRTNDIKVRMCLCLFCGYERQRDQEINKRSRDQEINKRSKSKSRSRSRDQERE